jgi:hypothetical protein
MSKAFLTVRENYADTPQPVPSSGWDYTDATLTAVKLTSGDFGGQGAFSPPALYEFTYIAKDPIVVGLGFASLRDLATFTLPATEVGLWGLIWSSPAGDDADQRPPRW